MIEHLEIHGLAVEVPEEAREEVNDAIHDVLRENHGIHPAAVEWEPPAQADGGRFR